MVDHDSTVVVANEMRVPPISFVIAAKDLEAHAESRSATGLGSQSPEPRSDECRSADPSVAIRPGRRDRRDERLKRTARVNCRADQLPCRSGGPADSRLCQSSQRSPRAGSMRRFPADLLTKGGARFTLVVRSTPLRYRAHTCSRRRGDTLSSTRCENGPRVLLLMPPLRLAHIWGIFGRCAGCLLSTSRSLLPESTFSGRCDGDSVWLRPAEIRPTYSKQIQRRSPCRFG